MKIGKQEFIKCLEKASKKEWGWFYEENIEFIQTYALEKVVPVSLREKALKEAVLLARADEREKVIAEYNELKDEIITGSHKDAFSEVLELADSERFETLFDFREFLKKELEKFEVKD